MDKSAYMGAPGSGSGGGEAKLAGGDFRPSIDEDSITAASGAECDNTPVRRRKQQKPRKRPAASESSSRKESKKEKESKENGKGKDKSVKKAKFRPSLDARRDIRPYSKGGKPAIPKLSFQRLVRELVGAHDPTLRCQSAAVAALHVASEDYLESLFSDALLCAKHRNAVTVLPKDLELARRIRGEKGHFSYEKNEG